MSRPNSCGVHIHEGTTCTGDALGHYFTGEVATDPWVSVVFNQTDSSGTTSGTVSVNTGASSEEQLVGRAVIVHARDGSRVACALLGDGVSTALQAIDFVPYYDNPGYAVRGVVGPVTTYGTTQTIPYSLTQTDASCAAARAC